MIPKRVKSVAITTTVTMNARPETREAKMAPMKPLPRARRKAMNERAQATGWRTMTRVRPSEVFSDAEPKSVDSIRVMMLAGL